MLLVECVDNVEWESVRMRHLAGFLVMILINSPLVAAAEWRTLFVKGDAVFQGKVLGEDGAIKVVQVRTLSKPERVDTKMLNCQTEESKLIGGSFYEYLVQTYGADSNRLGWSPFMNKTEYFLCEDRPFRAY